ncbi:glycoside hydrolase family 3 C-terminal domain-containing protein [Halosquirtibacter xylanolyticus]|uniref:glycoside hydrolase family 3 N-terminal domain-containing protein n=1 Tax=Halosquirtibacter xylanolyticus TaxID=3374599 RepID=UPI0037494B94|nr:glycoside hydrolase family 3 C-terminal domain-containing protein [Prolixibacteraceae bacterium]
MYKLLFILTLSLSLIACKEKKTPMKPIYLDESFSVNKRVEDLLSRMTLEEKIAQMCQYVGLEHMKKAEQNLTKEQMEESDAHGFYPELHSSDVEEMITKGLIGSFLHVVDVNEVNHLQALAQKSRLKIPLLIGIDAIHGTGLVEGATIYPTPIGLASTWAPDLVRKVSVETAKEMRATGATWTFTPNIDVARDARWGRVGETFGEDPLLVSKMGVAMIQGLQHSEKNGHFNVVACAKHLIAGSQSVNGINGAPTDLSERTIREIFLPPYKAAVEAGVFSIMTAHNELNGVACHADKWMMNDILREELGFKGFFVSDWMDIERLVTRHFVAPNQKEACFQTIDAGMDMHMHGPGFLKPVEALVKEGRISVHRIDQSIRRILEAKFKLGLFENPFVNTTGTTETTETTGVLFNRLHQATALEAAQKSIVLLKNKDNLLPINKLKYKKILVTGPNSNNETILGDWVWKQPKKNVVTILEGIREVAKGCEITYLNVGEDVRKIVPSKLLEAKRKAQKSDLAIVVVGENSFRWKWQEKTCGENAARSELNLVGEQQKLIKMINSTGVPTLVVFVNGRPLATEWIAENIPAIIESWEPGSMGGKAVAQIIFGEVNPSGKLPITIPRSVGHQLSIYNAKPSQYFHKYVTSRSDNLFSFGYGLSYSKFKYDNVRVSKDTIRSDESVQISVEVTNVGDVKGDEIVQFYLRDEFSSVTRPVKELKDFKRISLDPKESKVVSFKVMPHMLGFLGKDLVETIESGTFIGMVGSSSRRTDLKSALFYVTKD